MLLKSDLLYKRIKSIIHSSAYFNVRSYIILIYIVFVGDSWTDDRLLGWFTFLARF